MKITWLGTGSAFCLKNFQSSFIIEHNNKRLLVDAGGDCRWALNAQGLTLADIDAVYISHGHNDHVGGLEYVAFMTYFIPTFGKKKLFIDGGLSHELWDSALRLGLESLQGKAATLDTYFDVDRVGRDGGFFWNGIHFKLVQSVHVMSEYRIVNSFGLMFKDPESTKTTYFTSDTQFAPEQITDFYKQADVEMKAKT